MSSPSEMVDGSVADAQSAGTISETLLVSVGPSPASARVIRASHMMAMSLNARWIAAHVDTRETHDLDQVERHQFMENIHLAKGLGAEVASLSGQDVAEAIISYARSRGVTRIVIGKSGASPLRLLFRQTIVDRLLRMGADMDIYVIQSSGTHETRLGRVRWRRGSWWGYLGAVGAVGVACLIALGLQHMGLSEANRAVVFIPAVVAAAISWGLGPGVLAAVASVLAFDFFFVPPHFTLAVQDIQWLVTLVVLAAVALLVGTLAARLSSQVETARARERRLEILYRLTRALSGVSGVDALVAEAEAEVTEAFGGPSTIHLPGEDEGLRDASPQREPEPLAASDADREAAAWAFQHGEPAGRGTDTLPQAAALQVPMITAHGPMGVLSVEASTDVLLSPENARLLETTATQIGIAIERDALAETTRRAVLEAETERMRSSLLSSVSHDLRTPLAVIAGSASTLLQLGDTGDAKIKAGLLSEVCEESGRLTRLVENLLAMTRLDSGVIKANKQWVPVEEVVGSALGRLRRENPGREIDKHRQADLPLLLLDGVMIEQVLFNLLENAVDYSPADTAIDLFMSSTASELTVSVADRGPGLKEDELNAVFDKLYRGEASRQSTRGAGLGLTIARAMIHAHGGRIWAANRPGGGAAFSFTLPIEPPPAGLEMELAVQAEEQG